MKYLVEFPPAIINQNLLFNDLTITKQSVR